MNGKKIWKRPFCSRITSATSEVPKCTHSNAMHDGKSIPLFYYCSECVDDGPCTHHCCKLWIIHACTERGIDHEHCKRFVTSASSMD